MKQLLSVTVTTKTWTQGNQAWFDAKIKPGATVEVHWGDGKHSVFPQSGENLSRIEHDYSGKGQENYYEIGFFSDDEDALIALTDGTWEMTVHEVRIKNCGALKSLQYCQAQNLDLSGCPNLELLDCNGFEGENIDVSHLTSLKQLSLRMSPNVESLCLSKNPFIEVLDIGCCDKLTKVSLPNKSRLRLLSCDFTKLDRHSVKWLEKVIQENNGEIADWVEMDSLSI